MSEKSTWEEFFDAHAPIYDQNVFTRNTLHEAGFLLEELDLPPGAAILDVGCGTGRHSIELARRGYAMTGLDLSTQMLATAAQAASAAGVRVEWVHADATRFTLPRKFDGAICLCEGSLGLLGTGDDPVEHPLAVLKNIAASLKPQARAVFTVLNGLAMIRRYKDADVASGRFDPLGLVETSEYAPREDLPALTVRERAFVPTELLLLFRLAGMQVLNLWGGTAGKWGRRMVDLDEMEIMIVARREAEAAAR